jgi:phenylacetate-CoA ligase
MSHGAAVAVRELAYLLPVLVAPRRSRVGIERRALHGLQAMHSYARGHVPYYADKRYDVRLESLSDLTKLPVLHKETLRELGAEPFWSDHTGAFLTDQTSGSTGRVVRVRHNAAAYGYHGATVVRRFLSSGYRPWWTIAQIKPFPRPHRWFQRLGLFRRTVVPAGQPEEQIKRDVLKLRPNLVMGYPVMLRALLRQLSDAELNELRRSLRLVFSDSELLTEDQRQKLSDQFGVPVCDEYSAYEVLTVSSHCSYGAMHVDEDRVILELVDEHDRSVPEGDEGIVVVTHFRERSMPLLRYRLGDRAVLLPPGCRCGSRFRRMRLTLGRTEDFVQMPGGRRIYVPTFVGIGITLPGFTEFMVRQDEAGVLTVHVVPDPQAGMTFEQIAAGFRGALTDFLQTEADLRVVPIDKIELTPGGKAKLIESRYRPDPAGAGVDRG